jgi:pimeloyl-ACP methyl ester carboxylesterase
VTRGTWFYAATWQPLPHALTDLVEAGFQDVKPWTETYSAELEAATSLGEEATAKLKHPVDSTRYVIYRDGQRAWVGSNTLTARLTGRVMASLGRHSKNALVEVCRGYDFDASHNKVFPSIAQKDETVSRSPPAVTDLILVVHGIGQKLAETSEGWTFTHAVNRLRVNLHTQLAMPSVEQHVRPGFKFQVLPVNWRINLDLDAPPAADSDPKSFFTLDDITIDGIPAVRSLIGQVVLDIPYYMSHHKASMVDATVREANRIYALWIKHNRNFARSGRVHLVAHSLGSAISFDMLSQQPTDINASASLSTRLGRALSIRPPEDQERAGQFAFNTTNLFCAGSPAAFFLLLHRRHLVPRRRQTPDHDNPDATDGKITGQQGTYGSLACKNIYNLFYNTDPISYRMMATVDAALAQSLPPTHIPSTAAPYFSSFFSAAEKGEAPSSVSRPDLNQLPSTVELPQHDFSRERIADARLAMLNENRQIDYQLPAPGGLLEGSSQYLSMMTAHQAYWDSSEFARLLVLECGRRPGREHTLAMMRGVKRPEVPEGSKHAREYMSDLKKHSR